MAANSKSSAIAKRVVTQIWTSNSRHHLTHPPPPAPAVSFLRRGIHDKVYDKNQEDLGQPKTVPDEVIEPQSDKYWAPHPKTGVFGPAVDNNQGDVYSSASRGQEAVMEEKAWFRPSSLEDLEKPV